MSFAWCSPFLFELFSVDSFSDCFVDALFLVLAALSLYIALYLHCALHPKSWGGIDMDVHDSRCSILIDCFVLIMLSVHDPGWNLQRLIVLFLSC